MQVGVGSCCQTETPLYHGCKDRVVCTQDAAECRALQGKKVKGFINFFGIENMQCSVGFMYILVEILYDLLLYVRIIKQ